MYSIQRAIFGFLSLLLIEAVLFAQGRGTIDMRNQVAPIQREQIEAMQYDRLYISGYSDIEKPALPLAVSVQSISPISAKTGKALVELRIENIGKQPFRLPMSREAKVLHNSGNQERRILFCSMELISESSPADRTVAVGLIAYGGSSDDGSFFLLKQEESVVLRYEADFQSAWMPARRWKESIATGSVLAGVQCSQQSLALPPQAAANEKVYRIVSGEVVRSSNTVKLSLEP
jgi:hypothetical protein